MPEIKRNDKIINSSEDKTNINVYGPKTEPQNIGNKNGQNQRGKIPNFSGRFLFPVSQDLRGQLVKNQCKTGDLNTLSTVLI